MLSKIVFLHWSSALAVVVDRRRSAFDDFDKPVTGCGLFTDERKSNDFDFLINCPLILDWLFADDEEDDAAEVEDSTDVFKLDKLESGLLLQST
jgi:hypothetical protein